MRNLKRERIQSRLSINFRVTMQLAVRLLDITTGHFGLRMSRETAMN